MYGKFCAKYMYNHNLRVHKILKFFGTFLTISAYDNLVQTHEQLQQRVIQNGGGLYVLGHLHSLLFRGQEGLFAVTSSIVKLRTQVSKFLQQEENKMKRLTEDVAMQYREVSFLRHMID